LTEIVLLQAIRLACIIHDIGHWPFSHTMESVLEAELSVEAARVTSREEFQSCLRALRLDHNHAALHEGAGYRLMDYIFAQSLKNHLGQPFALLSLRLADGIIRGHIPGWTESTSVVGALKTLANSDLDADRADYVLRDGLASVFDF